MMIQSYLCRVPTNMVTTDRIHSHSLKHTPKQHKHGGSMTHSGASWNRASGSGPIRMSSYKSRF